MSTYCVTFTIDTRTFGGKTYDQRRERLIANVRQDGLGFWDGTTSFLLLESNLDTTTFARKAFAGLVDEDAVLVFDPSDMSAASFGAVEHIDVLKSFFPMLKKYKSAA